MALIKAEGLVLRTRDLGEADKIVVMYTRERGKLSGVARGSRRARSRLLAVSQLFVHGRFLLYEGRGLHSISQAELVNSFRPLREDLDRVAYASYFAELVDALVDDDEPNSDLFSIVLQGFTLVAGTDDLDLGLRWFELTVMSLLGYQPQLDHCVMCHGPIENGVVFSAKQGGVVCKACTETDATAVPVHLGVVNQLRRLLETPASRLGIFRPSQPDRLAMEHVLRAHIEHRLDRPLKSRGFLEAMRGLDVDHVTEG